MNVYEILFYKTNGEYAGGRGIEDENEIEVVIKDVISSDGGL